jgi:exopolysaccharide biosynthesis polyprenyl glycosylphosphotransferase
MAGHPEWGFQLAGFVLDDDAGPAGVPGPVLGRLSELGAVLTSHVVDEVFFALGRHRMDSVAQAIGICEELGVGAKVYADFFQQRIARVEVEDLDGAPMLSFTTVPGDPLALLAKRAFDVAVSGAAVALLSPLLLAVSLAIVVDSPGPVLFRQRRVGRNGREFWLYKFRSMRADAEAHLARLRDQNEADGPVFKMRNDPRITRVGRFLRKTSIDELPQFWNVLRGDMSVVGPRPPIPSEVREYHRWQRRRLSMRPGITCIWQISGRSDVKFDRWMELDLQYIDNWSFWDDLKIVFKTIPVVLIGKGAR